MSKWNVAAYLRLSSDDGDKAESNSIGNQRSIINQYIKQNKEFIFLMAWNEWGEGSYLEPDTEYKYGYLEAIKKITGEIDD